MANRHYLRPLCFALALLITATVLLLYFGFARVRPSIDNISQVSIGMAQSEVELLLGDPTYKVSPTEIGFGGDSDSPAGAAIGLSLFDSDDRGYWEYQLGEAKALDRVNPSQNEGDLATAAVSALFSRPDEKSLVIFFGPNGTVDEIKLPGPSQ